MLTKGENGWRPGNIHLAVKDERTLEVSEEGVSVIESNDIGLIFRAQIPHKLWMNQSPGGVSAPKMRLPLSAWICSMSLDWLGLRAKSKAVMANNGQYMVSFWKNLRDPTLFTR